MATPVWLGATPAQPAQAGQVNQFLGTHQITYIYTGVTNGSSTTLAGTGTNTNGLYIAEQINPGTSATIQRWVLNLSVTGTPTPLTFTIQTNSAGAPSGVILSTTLIPKEYLTGTATNVSVPTAPVSFVSGTSYWFVFNAVGDASDYYTVGRTTATSGASTSTNGTTWTTQTYGLYYNRFDNTVVQPLVHTYEDTGARWTTFTFNASNQPTALDEYTAAQGTNQYMYSSRSFTYTSGSLTSVS